VTDADAQAPVPDGSAEREGARGRLTSAASTGGAAGASGVGLQNRVFGWAAAAMVAEQPLPRPKLVAGVVVRVGAQTGHELDDVAVQTDADNYALCQVKAGLNLGTAESSPLGKALQQAVKQYLKGPLRAADGTERAVDPERDALVICTDCAAPATVKDHLAAAIRRTASQPPGTSLGQGSTALQRKALNVLLGHVRRLWVAEGQAAPDDEQLRRFLRALHVITVDANDGEADHAVAVHMLSTPLQEAGDAARAWPVLVAEGQGASVGRDWRDWRAIGVALARAGIQLSPPAKHSGDIAKLREVTATNLQTLQSDAVLPVAGGLYIGRSVGVRLLAEAGEDNVLVVGDAGAGKSAVAQEFATRRSESQEVVVLRASDIAGANRIQLDAPLTSVLRAWTGSAGVVLIDGIDALRGAEDREFLSSTVADLRGSRWQIVATVRTFDARNSRQLQQAFRGAPISDDFSQIDGRLTGVRHLMVGDLTDSELDTAVVPPLPLAALLAEAPHELRALLRNPFNLRLAAQLTSHLSGGQHSELLAVRSRADLLEAYWSWRVYNADRTAREALLSRLCHQMLSSRSLRVIEAEPAVTAADSAAVEAMLSENVLSGDSGTLAFARRVLSFSHNILFDYATAIYVLFDPLDPGRLLGTLDADPSLPLVARPSFDILVDLLWKHRDNGLFWRLCLEVAGSPHVLASLAFAARLLNLVRAAEDLAPLAPESGRADRPEGMWPGQHFIGQLVGALRTPAVLAEPGAAVVPLAALAQHLAANAMASFQDAALAANLLIGLQLRVPLRAGDPGADDRSLAVAALLDACRTDPQQMEGLAEVTARQLPHAIAASPVVRDAVERLLGDDDALRQWGGTVLTWLAEAVVPTVPHDPDLARRMAGVVLTFQETRDEQVTFAGGPLLPLRESRRQQAEHGAYVLGQAFGELCAADLRVAAEVFCDLANEGAGPQTSDRWLMSVPNADGWLQYGRRDLSMIAHGAGEQAAAALSAALTSADPADATPAVAVLVERLHNAAAWAAIMMPAGDAVALGRVFLPLLESGTVLSHPETHAAAADLLAALAENEPALAGRLEAAVLQAHALADVNGGSQRVKDALLGCLRREAITSPALIARLDELGPEGPPGVVPWMDVTATFEPWSLVEDLSKRGIELEAPVEAAAGALSEELGLVRSGSDKRPESERRLLELFLEADATFGSAASVPADLERLLVDSAAALAHDRRVRPGTPVGERVLALLTASATRSDAGSFLQ
jgi:hypothetical protein